MKRQLWKALLLFAGIAAQPVLACDECRNAARIAIGETREIGNGLAYSWVKLDRGGKPLAVGVTLTESALTGLPEATTGMKDMPEYPLALPKAPGPLPFDHLCVNWNPKGHEPAGVYDVPHFDFHFYLISQETRSRITAAGADLAKCRKQPSAALIPSGYIYAPGAEVPRMGAHWVDAAAPELHGQRFTRSFLYGSYDGQVVHVEPMITKAYLESRPNETQPMKLPAAYPKRGYYPTSYTVKYDPVRREYTIALGALRYRDASGTVARR